MLSLRWKAQVEPSEFLSGAFQSATSHTPSVQHRGHPYVRVVSQLTCLSTHEWVVAPKVKIVACKSADAADGKKGKARGFATGKAARQAEDDDDE